MQVTDRIVHTASFTAIAHSIQITKEKKQNVQKKGQNYSLN